MDKKFSIDYSFTEDRIIDDFLNKNVSLESLIENEIFKHIPNNDEL